MRSFSYPPLPSPLLLLSLGLTLPQLTQAYSWAFQAAPQQCTNLTVTVTGTGGQPPYRILILPFGPTPLANNIEARRIKDLQFPGTASSVTFNMNYPENSQFVAVVSDSTGFGSGGTSVAAQVVTSSDASCFNATANVSPDFVFSIDPPNQIVQCQDSRIWWDPTTVEGTPNFLGVIPGGQSFAVPESNITNVTSEGTGFTWEPSLRGGTTLILVGGDGRGNGTAGSVLNVVSSGTENDSSCLTGNSPSSTPGNPAGGSYPTGTGAWTGGGGSSSGKSSDIGAIVGGVLGGLALIIAVLLLVWFLRKQKKDQKRLKERPVDLLNAGEDDEEDGDGQQHANRLPQYYTPEPFTATRTSAEITEDGRPLSGASSSFYTRTSTPDGLTLGSHPPSSFVYGAGAGTPGGSTTATSRKGGPPRAMRTVNIIQHDDAGPPQQVKEEEPETIELPPAYHALGGGGGGATGGGGGAAGTTPA